MAEAFNEARLKVNRLQCQRADWPTVPNPPPYDTDNENFKSYQIKLMDEKKIRQALPKISPCQGGLCNGPSCVNCSKTECEFCVLDKKTPEMFQRYHDEEDPTPEHEDCYGTRPSFML